MIVTDEQVAMLRAYLARDDAEFERLGNQPEPPNFQTGFSALVATAFLEAVNRQFGQSWLLADVVSFVAHVRARYLDDSDLLDPSEAENLIRTALGDQQAATALDDEAKARGQVLLLPALIDDQGVEDKDPTRPTVSPSSMR